MTQKNIGRLLVFVRPELDNGPILIHSGCFSEEVWERGWDISDHEMPCATRMGLYIFEGFISYSPGPEPDIYFSGEYRDLTHWEMCRLRIGLIPWGDD